MDAEQIIGALLIAFILWLGRIVLAFAKEMTEWRILLFGREGKNGMRGQINDHEARLRELERAA